MIQDEKNYEGSDTHNKSSKGNYNKNYKAPKNYYEKGTIQINNQSFEKNEGYKQEVIYVPKTENK